MTFFDQKFINMTPHYSQVFCNINYKEFTNMDYFLQSIALLDKKIASIEVGSSYSNALGINQITKKHFDFINDHKTINKEILTCVVESIINSSRIVLLDHISLLVSRATIQDICKNSLVIVVPMNHLKLPDVNIEYNHLMLKKRMLKLFFRFYLIIIIIIAAN